MAKRTTKIVPFSLIILLIISVGAMAGPVPDTGQTQSYTDTFGEDSDYTINPPSYTKLDANGNELPDSATSWVMVRDNVTGLIWEVKTDDGSVHDKDNQYTWYDSNPETNGGNAGTPGDGTDTADFIKALNDANFGGFSDWRLPTVKELARIVDRGAYTPAINSEYFPNTVSSYYWSSTTNADCTNYAWRVHFNGGNVSYYVYKSFSYRVRAVRGGVSGSFDNLVINGDGTVTDTATGLMWQQETARSMSLEAALEYCEGLALAGYEDWRLPNISELQSLVDYSEYGPAIDTTVFPGTVSSGYWSSTTSASRTDFAWLVSFYDGTVTDDYKWWSYRVRAVRGGQCWSLGHLVISAPKQGAAWRTGAEHEIRWDPKGLGGNVKISLSSQGGKENTFETIEESTPNVGSYTWSVTGSASVNCVLKIEPVGDSSKGTSLGLFKVYELKATILGAPDDFTTQTEATLTISGDEITHYKYKLDTGIYGNETAVTTPINLTGLTEGSHSISLIGKDSFGNWQAESNPTTAIWIVDTTAPVITDLTDDSIPTQIKTWTWDATDANATTFRYAIDQNETWPNPSGTYSDTKTATKSEANGIWYIHVQAKDAAGNESDVVTVSAILDNTGPVITGLSDDADPVQSKTWIWGATDVDDTISYRYQIDQNQVWFTPSGNYSVEATASKSDGDGVWYLHVQARDRARNETEVATVSAVIDNTAPIAIISEAPSSPTNQTEATLTIGTGDVTHYKYRVDDGDYSGEIFVATGITLTGLSEGRHTVYVVARDAAGNWQSTDSAAIISWTVDTTKPVVTGLSNDSTLQKSKTWTWYADEPSTFRYTIDQNAQCAPTGNFADVTTATKSGADGTWYLHVQSKDAAGNETDVVTVSAILDNTSPTVNASLAGGLFNADQTVSLCASETADIYYSTDGSDPTATCTEYTSGINITETTTLKFIAIDIAGNSSIVYTEIYTIDKEAPTTPVLTAVGDGNINDDTPTLEWSIVEGADSYTVQYSDNSDFNNATEVTGIVSTSYDIPSALSDGTWYWRVKAIDVAGNESEWNAIDRFIEDAATERVPSEYSTIQAAIDAASDGDTVLVQPGTYLENINFNGNNIVLESQHGAVSTIIIPANSGIPVAWFHSGENPTGKLIGFTLKDGANIRGSALRFHSSHPTIENCIITASTGESAISYYYSGAVLKNCLIHGNSSTSPFYFDESDSYPQIINCTIANNDGYGAGYTSPAMTKAPKFKNCIIFGNSLGGAFGYFSITYSLVEGGYTGTGNIDDDPFFVGESDYHLTPISPCRDRGTSSGAPPTDIAGVSRPKGFGYDMGAYEEFVIAGDVDVTGTIDLNDVILSFQVCAGMIPSLSLCTEADVNGDGTIGMEEVIYVLQNVSGLR